MATTLGFSDFNMNGEDAELKDKFDRKRKNKTIKKGILKKQFYKVYSLVCYEIKKNNFQTLS